MGNGLKKDKVLNGSQKGLKLLRILIREEITRGLKGSRLFQVMSPNVYIFSFYPSLFNFKVHSESSVVDMFNSGRPFVTETLFKNETSAYPEVVRCPITKLEEGCDL